MEGALLRSLLDIDCLKSLTHEQSMANHGSHTISAWENIQTPVLSLDESIDLIRKTGLDSNLLSLLGLETTDPGLKTDQDVTHSDKNTTANVILEIEPHKETVLELETAPVEDTRTQVNPDEDQKEQELEHPSEVGG